VGASVSYKQSLISEFRGTKYADYPQNQKAFVFTAVSNPSSLHSQFFCVLSGVTCIQRKAGRGPSGEESMCILQLTEAGDIFYQILEHKLPDHHTSGRPAAENEPAQRAKKLPQPASQRKAAEQHPPEAQLVASDTSSCEDVIGPTQGVTVQTIVVETPEKERPRLDGSLISSSAGSETESRCLNSGGHVSRLDAGMKDGNVAVDEVADGAECHSQQQTPVI